MARTSAVRDPDDHSIFSQFQQLIQIIVYTTIQLQFNLLSNLVCAKMVIISNPRSDHGTSGT